MDRHEFVKLGAALAVDGRLGQRRVPVGENLLPLGVSRSIGRMAWPAGTWYRPYTSRIARETETTTWVQIDLKQVAMIDCVRVYPAFTLGDEHASGYGFPRRFRIEVSDNSSWTDARMIADRTAEDVPEVYDDITEFGAGGIAGRYVRLTATHLRKSQDGLGFALAMAW